MEYVQRMENQERQKLRSLNWEAGHFELVNIPLKDGICPSTWEVPGLFSQWVLVYV
jgi:hypothetical protein